MPPSRELVYQINEKEQKRLEDSLKLKYPVRVKVTRNPVGKIHGTYNHQARLIVLNLGKSGLAESGLRAVNVEVTLTLLHEYRHAHQHDHWTPEKIARDNKRSYKDSEMEKDAEDYAQANGLRWLSLGKVRVKSVGSSLKRLSQAERSIRT